ECDTEHVAAILSEMSPDESSPLIEGLQPRRIAELLSELPPDDAASLTNRLPEPLAAQVLALMEARSAADVRELLEHEEQTAGRIMTPDYFALEEDVTVSEAITALQKRAEQYETIFYLYVVDKRNHPIGVVSLRRLLITPPATPLKRIMTPDVITVRTDTNQSEVARLIADHNLLAIPVVDEEDRLVGLVTVDDAMDVVEEEAAEDLLALAGVAAEERMNTGPWRSLRLRAPWLLVNLPTAFLAAYVVSLFEETIENNTALAALMPIVAGMGGNAATQTLTVVIRGIATGEAASLPRVTLKSALVGAGNGIITGLVGAGFAAIVTGKVWVGGVLAAAMVINLIVAAVAGTIVPFALKKLGIDPAVSSSIFVTTCTDVAGFFSFLGIATLLMRMGGFS
ncbi:MAG TPA: magnesium transporter, partial [Blastocatellia bacterium]|nr:magnesium transporter [Blastocatellia bacterium]